MKRFLFNQKNISGGMVNDRKKITGKIRLAFALVFMLILTTGVSLAHCDTMDGPVIKDAKLALESSNINYVMKWIQAGDEAELEEAFSLTMKVRVLGPEAQTLADRYFFDTLVRIHRVGEGVGFTGISPAGTPVDEKVLAADKAIEAGNLNPLRGLVPEEKKHELHILFDRVMELRNFDINDVTAGRKYVAAYVSFFKFAEGEEHAHNEAHDTDHEGHH